MFPNSPILPLARLQVTDGLLMTAERWHVAHSYHRHRQNLHFQAIAQPGIVQGLGVCPIPAPEQIASQYRDGRWLQIQPGLAIDRQGNPILVPQPVDYHIDVKPGPETVQVYLVLRFVDPDQLDDQQRTHVVQETFRLEEKITPPTAYEIELCRLRLSPGDAALGAPQDSFEPMTNELDLRYRPCLQTHPQGQLHLGYLTLTPEPQIAVERSLQGLISALPGLYPTFQGSREIGRFNLRQGQSPAARQEELQIYDLLHLSAATCQQLQPTEIELLTSYLGRGGMLLLEAPLIHQDLNDLVQIWSDVTKALANFTATPDSTSLQAELQQERTELERCMGKALVNLVPALPALLTAANVPAEAWPHTGQLQAQHPLRTQPFAFGILPLVNETPLALFNWGGIVVVLGQLSCAWGGEEAQFLGREAIRSAHELGINLLHFAWQRRHWISCLTPTTLTADTASDAPLAVADNYLISL